MHRSTTRSAVTSRGRHRHAAFTLIELLVVVTIIAILASLLLPALSSARAKAKVSACLNQQKQLGMGFNMYADEYDDWGVSGVNWGSTNMIGFANRQAWIDSYFPLTGPSHHDLFVCPATAPKARVGSYRAGYRISTRQYMSYLVLFGTGDRPVTAGSVWFRWCRYVNALPTNQYRAPVPRRTMAGTIARDTTQNSSCYVGEPEDSGIVSDLWRTDNRWYGYGLGWVPNNHEGMDGVNTVFLDGHGGWKPISSSKQRYKNYYVWWYW